MKKNKIPQKGFMETQTPQNVWKPIFDIFYRHSILLAGRKCYITSTSVNRKSSNNNNKERRKKWNNKTLNIVGKLDYCEANRCFMFAYTFILGYAFTSTEWVPSGIVWQFSDKQLRAIDGAIFIHKSMSISTQNRYLMKLIGISQDQHMQYTVCICLFGITANSYTEKSDQNSAMLGIWVLTKVIPHSYPCIESSRSKWR